MIGRFSSKCLQLSCRFIPNKSNSPNRHCTQYGQIIYFSEFEDFWKTSQSHPKKFRFLKKYTKYVIANSYMELKLINLVKNGVICKLNKSKKRLIRPLTNDFDECEKHVELPTVENAISVKVIRFATLLNKPDFKASKEWENWFRWNLCNIRNLSSSLAFRFVARGKIFQKTIKTSWSIWRSLRINIRMRTFSMLVQLSYLTHMLERILGRIKLAAAG